MKKQLVIHPVLFSLFPALFLYAMNSGYYELSVIAIPLLICVAAGLLSWGLAVLFIRDHRVAAMVVSVFFLVSFSFGAVYDSFTRAELESKGYGAGAIPPGELIIVVCLVVGLAAAGLMFRLRRFTNEWTYVMNVVGTILVFLPLTNIAMSAYVSSSAAGLLPESPDLLRVETVPLDDASKPDIYHLVLDGYGSAEVLQREFQFDNSELISFLESRGFRVPSNAHSNYSETASSLSSMLNGVYLHEAVGDRLGDYADHQFLRRLMRDNFVERFLRANGYEIIAFGTPYENARLDHPDVLLNKWGFAQPFTLAVFEMTPVPWLFRKAGFPLLYEMHRQRILYTLDELGELPKIAGPKFVYAHMLFAHTPFVFGPDGEPVNPDRRFHMWVHGDLDENISGYRNQVQFLNQRLMKTIDRILENSSRPPVIVIHGDHGPGMKDVGLEGLDVEERFGILYAILLPGGRDSLETVVSPVNAYRAIFDHCFGTDYPLLKHVSYYTPRGRPYAFTPVELPITASSATLGSQD